MHSPCFLPTVRDAAPPSLPGVRAEPVPPLRRYYEALRRPAAPFASLLGFARRYPPVRLCSSLPSGPTPAGGPELCGGAAPRPAVSRGERLGLPGSWGTFVCLCPVLRPRQDRTHQALAVRRRGPRIIVRRRLPRFSNFGAQWHGLDTRCLRFAAWVAPARRPTRFRLLAKLYRAGLATCKVPTKGFRHDPYMSSPFPKLPGANDVAFFCPFSAPGGQTQPKCSPKLRLPMATCPEPAIIYE